MATKEQIKINDQPKISKQSKPRTRAEDLRNSLENMIVDGLLAPGEKLDEMEIAERFGVSRTPVREALRALSSTGLVEVKGRRGMTVAAASISTLLEMFEMMSAMEGLCAKFAARRATPQQKRELRELHAELISSLEENDPDAFYEINARFHNLIYDASHTEFLAEQTRAVRRRVAPYRRHVTFQPGQMQDTIGEHEAILRAIEDADPAAAQGAASKHILLLGDNLTDFIASLPPGIR
ncbi:MAG: GntR family transcriptional regulator [Rhizobiaceae bacterium]